MPATPAPRNGFGQFLHDRGWTHQHAARVLGVSQATISRIASGVQEIPPTLARLIDVIERHPRMAGELADRWAP